MSEIDQAQIQEAVRKVLKEEFKGLFLDAFEPFATSIQQEFLKLNQRLDKVEERLASLEERLASLEKRLESLEKRAEKLETQTSQILRRLDNIDAAISDERLAKRETRTEVELLKERIAELESRLKRFEGLETRLAKLEAAQHGRS